MILTSPTGSNIEIWLSQETIAKGGGSFIPADDIWKPDSTANSSNIAAAKYAVQEPMRPWLTAALVYYAKERSARTLKSITYVLSRCGASRIDVLSEADVLAMRNRFSHGEFSILRVFLKLWCEDYLLDVHPSERLIKALYEIKSNDVNRPCPVESMDPDKGPFTLFEMQSLFDWANDAYANNKISIEKFAYIRLLIATGARTRQIQQLVFGDIANIDNESTLKMPKAKNRGFEYRNSFQFYKLAPDLYGFLIGYQKITLQHLQSEQPDVDWIKAISNVPLFRAKGTGSGRVIIIDVPGLRKLEDSPQEEFHKPDYSMKALLRGFKSNHYFPISERTAKRIHLGSHRFRHTLGTDMSRMGFGPHAIAQALGHKNIRNVGRYIKTSPEMGKRIEDKIKSELSLVVNAFQGRIVECKDEATNGSYSNKTIRGQQGAIATCGATGDCHLDAPTACYTCSKFQPWVEGPHEKVLERLQVRQQRAVDAAGQGSDTAISFDRSILAVMQVIDKINIMKEEAID